MGKNISSKKICWAEQPLKYIDIGKMLALVSWESIKKMPLLDAVAGVILPRFSSLICG